jgi:hypothetical protein
VLIKILTLFLFLVRFTLLVPFGNKASNGLEKAADFIDPGITGGSPAGLTQAIAEGKSCFWIRIYGENHSA